MPTARSISGISWSTPRPTSGCGSNGCVGHVVHFVGADDAHGAPIMLKAEAEGISPQELVARITADRPRYLQGFLIDFDNWHSTDSPENVALSQDIYLRLKAAGLIYVKPRGTVLRSREEHVSRGSLHQGRVPELSCEGPVCRRLRILQHRQHAGRSDRSVLDAVRRETAVGDIRPLLLPAVRSAVRRVPERLARHARPAAAAGGQ